VAAPQAAGFDSITPKSKDLRSKRPGRKNCGIHALVVEDHPASRQILSLQLEALGIHTSVCENANIALDLIQDHHFDLMLTDQSMPGMQGSELAKHIRSLGNRDLVIIGVTADIYALDSRHQFLSSGMNGVLIKPLSLGALENELMRYFESSQHSVCTDELYSFDAFSNLIKEDPQQIIVILEEIEKVHLDALVQLRQNINQTPLNEMEFQSLVHKVKGGAQLLQATQFVQACQDLEVSGSFLERIQRFIALLEEQNQTIEAYKKRYQT
jgi:two-component system sensor histidine kinase EvgS